MTSLGPGITNAAAHLEQDMCDGSQARVGGMLSGKCGLVYCHMGAAKQGLQPLMDAVAMSDVPITQFLPTHMERRSAPLTSSIKGPSGLLQEAELISHVGQMRCTTSLPLQLVLTV